MRIWLALWLFTTSFPFIRKMAVYVIGSAGGGSEPYPQAEFTGRVLPLLHQTARCGEFRDISCAYACACSGSRVDSSSFSHTSDDAAFGGCDIRFDEPCQYHPRAYSVHWTFHRTVKVGISKNLGFFVIFGLRSRFAAVAALKLIIPNISCGRLELYDSIASRISRFASENVLKPEKDKSEFHLS